MSQKLSVNDFKWVEETSQFNEDFIKSYNDDSDEGIFLKLMFNILKICITFTIIYPFWLKEWKFKKFKNQLPKKMERAPILMNKLVYLGLPI